ncbi:Zinc protease-like protein [hydrothermal vent metagenome]|uniref:Zinc protease-like protein n=1 Tax=hydrothermal vent metagenome TaxID=652676 RepID=A0A1W1D0H0_9ZZZZ
MLVLQGVLMATQIKEIEVNEQNISILYEQGEYIPIVSMQLVFSNAGQLSEHINGLAGLSANLFNEGTSKEGSMGFALKLDAKAIDIGTHVGRESFVIEVSSLKSEFPYAVERLIELLKDPNYTKEALEQIKHQKLGWLSQKKSDFGYISASALRQSLFKGTALAEPYDGTLESIEAISLQNIQDFISSHLGINNLMVVVGGDIGFEEVSGYVKDIAPLFAKIENKAMKPIEASAKKETILIEEETEQAYIYFGSPFYYSYKSQDQHLAKIAEYLLGGAGFGSRLMEEIRVKRGLTYGVYASLRRTKPVSYLSGSMQTKLSSQDEAKALIQEVVDDFIKNGITKEELEDTKKFLLGSEPLRTETLSQRLGRAFSDYYYERPLGFAKIQLEKLEAVTLEEVNTFIKSHTELSDLSFAIVTKK